MPAAWSLQGNASGSQAGGTSIDIGSRTYGVGNLVIVDVFCQNSQAITSVSDPTAGANTWTLDQVQTTARLERWYSVLAQGFTGNISCAFAGFQTAEASAWEFSGNKDTGVVDASTANFTTAGSTNPDGLVAANLTTTADGDLLFCTAIEDGGFSIAAGTGFTPAGNVGATGQTNLAEYRTQTTHGAVSATYTVGAQDDYHVIFSAFKARLTEPTITQQPQNASVLDGDVATFTAAATSSGGSLGYQWKKNGGNVGANSATYSDTFYLADSGSLINCFITDNNGNATTGSATLTVRARRPLTRRRREVTTFDYSGAGWFSAQFNSAGMFDKDMFSTGGLATLLLELARTEARDTLSASMSATLTLNSNVTEKRDTVAATAAVLDTLLLAITEKRDTLAATIGSPALQLVFERTEARDAPALTLGAIAGLRLDRSEARDWPAATAAALDALSLERTEKRDVLAASSSALLQLALALTERRDFLAAAAGATATTNLALQERRDTLSAVAAAVIGLNASLTERRDTLSAQASALLTLTASLFERRDTVAASQQAALATVLALQEVADTPNAAIGSLSGMALTANEHRDTAAAIASASLALALVGTEPGDTVAATASALVALALIGFERRDALVANAEALQSSMALAIAEVDDVVGAVARSALQAAAEVQEQSDTPAISAALALAANLNSTEHADTRSATMTAAIALFLAITENPNTLRSAAVMNVGGLSPQHAAWLEFVARTQGLIDPLVVNRSTGERGDGQFLQTFSGDANLAVLTTVFAPDGAAAASALTPTQASWLEAIVRVLARIDPLTVTPTSRGDGTMTQTIADDGTSTTVTRTS